MNKYNTTDKNRRWKYRYVSMPFSLSEVFFKPLIKSTLSVSSRFVPRKQSAFYSKVTSFRVDSVTFSTRKRWVECGMTNS